ncbi:zinc finger BED domain-containing protein RICESLEEPER 2 [Tanacetum coccineum]
MQVLLSYLSLRLVPIDLKNHISHLIVKYSKGSAESEPRSGAKKNDDGPRWASVSLQSGIIYVNNCGFGDSKEGYHLKPLSTTNETTRVFQNTKATALTLIRDLEFADMGLQLASESAFSKSGRILSIRRTRLTAESLEMCMCLKDHLDAHERRQHTTPLELPLDVEEGVFNDEVQMNEATQLTDQEIALDASSTALF